MVLRWFVDESTLGLGKLLTRTRDDVIYAGHPNLPEIPLGTSDVGWMPIVAERNWVAIRRDRRIHTRPLEVRVSARSAYVRCGSAERRTWAHSSNSISSSATGKRSKTVGKSSAQVRGVSRCWAVDSHRGSGDQRPKRSTASRLSWILSIGLSINCSLRRPLVSFAQQLQQAKSR